MSNKRFFTFLAAAAITVSGFAFYTHAAPGRPGPGGRGQIIQRIISELDLSEDQVEKIKGELRDEKENITPLIEQLHEARKNLRETIQSDADEKNIRSAHAKVATVEADLAVQRAKIRSRIVPHLTEEQLQKMKKMEAKLDEMAENAIRHFGERLEK